MHMTWYPGPVIAVVTEEEIGLRVAVETLISAFCDRLLERSFAWPE